MVMDILIEIAKGIGRFFINPLFYILTIVGILAGWQRVRRERRSFGIKVNGMFNNIVASILPSLLFGLIGTVLLLVAGVSLPMGVVVLVTACYFVTMLTVQLRFLSPSIAIGLAILIAYGLTMLPEFQTDIALIDGWLIDISNVSYFDFGLFLTVSILMEAFLILIWGSKKTSPRLINSKRGKKVGAHEANQLWIAPLFFLIPVDGPIHSFGWWPLADGTAFGLYALPIGIGLQQLISHTLPRLAVKATGKWVLSIGIIALACTAGAYFYQPAILIAVAGGIAFLSKIWLVIKHHREHLAKAFYFTDNGTGLRVIGVVPNSPAEKMDVQIGEVVSKVNGQDVFSEEEFYEALQINSTYCKLSVLNLDGEVRFVKGPIHQNELHKIGLLFLEPPRRANWKGQAL